jgi:hypothetical protein
VRFSVRRYAKQVKAYVVLVAAPHHCFESSPSANFFVQHFLDIVGRIKMSYRFQNTRFVLENASERIKSHCSTVTRGESGIVPPVVELEQAFLFLACDEVFGHTILRHGFDLNQIKFIVSLSRLSKNFVAR